MNPTVARKVNEMFAKMTAVKKDHGLTEREQATLELMAKGLAKKQIADQLNLNQHTVDYVFRCIYRKLHVNCVAAAVSVAVKDHLVSGSGPLASDV